MAGVGKVAVLASLPLAANAQEVTIAALGDSLTQGYGLLPEQGFVPQLQAWLRARGHEVRLINAGVSGDTTAGGLSRVAWTLTEDVDAMIVALGGNDILRGLPPEASRANLEGILRAARDAQVAVLLVGLRAPGNYGPDYQQSFDAIFPELADAYGVLLAESFFRGLDTDDPALARGLMQPDGIHPNEAGVARIVEGLGPRVEALIRSVREP